MYEWLEKDVQAPMYFRVDEMKGAMISCVGLEPTAGHSIPCDHGVYVANEERSNSPDECHNDASHERRLDRCFV